MRSAGKVFWAFLLAMPFLILNSISVSAFETDDTIPEVTARVARISFIKGDVQIKRAEQTDWERATNNLPIVEGDEIVTDANARLEIQFSSEKYLRLSENARLVITTLRDEGIAVSLPNGSLSARLLKFNKEQTFFEIDAPQTTVSIEKSGMYRVDAGNTNEAAVRVTVTDAGEARIFSENSGLTLKNGRSASIQIGGDYAGEWETSNAEKFADEFEGWALQRDAVIAKRLQKADYDKYYDRDFYGAEDLNEYGEWIFTKKYGYVWRPFPDSVSSYADWSPYRYGQWRWIPVYGWTWVNDEPWGWATYHHGRWVYDDGYWYWTPYAQNRGRRSWWRPALVVLSNIGNNICWYPLPYNYNYYNYNSYYYDRRKYKKTVINNTTIIVNPTPTPTPVIGPALSADSEKVRKVFLPPPVPETGVVTVDASDFGRNKGNFRNASGILARKALAEVETENVKPVILPTFKDLNGKISREILVENPRIERPVRQTRIGATERIEGVSIGENLRKERIFGNRSPIRNGADGNSNNDNTESVSPIRNTGAIRRQTRVESTENGETPIRPLRRKNDDDSNPIRPNGNDETQIQTPNRIRRNENRETTPPVNNPPREERLERPQPRRERQEQPREERRVEAPNRSEPRREEPRREEPRREETVRPPAPRLESPREAKPSEPIDAKDNRDNRR